MILQLGLVDLTQTHVGSHVIGFELQRVPEVLLGLVVVALQTQDRGILDQRINVFTILLFFICICNNLEVS